MTEIKLEIGDNLKAVMLELMKNIPNAEYPASVALQTAFGIDFSKILKGMGKKIVVIDKNRAGRRDGNLGLETR